eukprot:246432-Pleurochrysis_carterae.AAC.1
MTRPEWQEGAEKNCGICKIPRSAPMKGKVRAHAPISAHIILERPEGSLALPASRRSACADAT